MFAILFSPARHSLISFAYYVFCSLTPRVLLSKTFKLSLHPKVTNYQRGDFNVTEFRELLALLASQSSLLAARKISAKIQKHKLPDSLSPETKRLVDQPGEPIKFRQFRRERTHFPCRRKRHRAFRDFSSSGDGPLADLSVALSIPARFSPDPRTSKAPVVPQLAGKHTDPLFCPAEK